MSLVASLNKLNKSTTFTLNYNRLSYLLSKFNISREQLLELTNLKEKDFDNPVKLQTLKKLDEIFNQGLSFYYRKDNITNKNISIFLRKENIFSTDINLESRKVIDNYEKLTREIHSLSKNIEYSLERKLDTFNLNEKPQRVAEIIRIKFENIENTLKEHKILDKKIINNLNISTNKSDNERIFLKNIVTILDELNVIVFEYVEHPRKKEKINFNGCYIQPNVIVMKKEPKEYIRKQLFTLFHELGHHLLDIEEVDQIDESIVSENKIEKWCNEFAFQFLINNCPLSKENLEEVYQKTFLSYSSLYTDLRKKNIMSQYEYDSKQEEIKRNILLRKEREQRERESKLKDEMSKKGIDITEESIKEYKKKHLVIPPAKPIMSGLYRDLVAINFEQGSIKEFELERLMKGK